MDSGRIKDLQRLDGWIKDPKLPSMHRRKAMKTKAKIVSQLGDSNLTAMRERLMRASYNNDKREMWKITNLIKNYIGEEGVEEWEKSIERV